MCPEQFKPVVGGFPVPVPEAMSPPVVLGLAPPTTISIEQYERDWKPQGWGIIFIGPTATWRKDWGRWEAIRDIVQNALDEAESYQYGYDRLGFYIADQGRGVAVADFLLGPPKLKPDYARGKFGEGMKIAGLALVRDGYPVYVETVGRELYIVFLEQQIDGRAQTLAALWRPYMKEQGTTFHIIGYTGTSYADRFTVNLPRDAFLFNAPSPLVEPRQRYNQLITTGAIPGATKSRIYARDIFMKETSTAYSYNLWGFEMAPDRFGPKSESGMWTDVGRLWVCVDSVDLLRVFLQMVTDPPMLDTEESRNVRMSLMGLMPGGQAHYRDELYSNISAWQQAWREAIGSDAVIRTTPSYDSTVTHLNYRSVTLQWDVRDVIARVIKTDTFLIQESQERLREVEVIPDSTLTARQLASLVLARAIVTAVRPYQLVGGVHAAIIPPASDRTRTAGMWSRTTKEIFISASQLEQGRDLVDTLIHELAHHISEADDLEEKHVAEISRLGGVIASLAAKRAFDPYLESPDFSW